jgi:hypothetical protein
MHDATCTNVPCCCLLLLPATGAHTDLMESYFLSETVKYLYLSFVDSGPLLDYYVLSTEGHLMPAFPNSSDRHLIEADLPQQQQQEIGQGTEVYAAAAAEEEEAGLDVDQGAMWGDLPDYDDSQQQQQQRQGDEAKQQAAGSNGGAAAAANESRSGSCAAALQSNSNDSSSNSSSNTTAAAANAGVSGEGVGATSSSLVGKPLGSLPANCRGLCEARSAEEEGGYEARLHAALPLLPVRQAYSRRIR